jgi:hypothetical protein
MNYCASWSSRASKLKYKQIGKRKRLDGWHWDTPKMSQGADLISYMGVGLIVAFDISIIISMTKYENSWSLPT